MVCPGYAMSVTHKKLMLLKNATVNWNLNFDDLCKEKIAYVAYNNRFMVFVVLPYSGKMLFWPGLRAVNYINIAQEHEIQEAFFKTNNIKPIWLWAYQNWGTLNYTTGQWSGAVGMIQRDEADYALFGFLGTYNRSKVATFSLTQYQPSYWLTRYPLELPPTWNLLGLFTKGYISHMSFL